MENDPNNKISSAAAESAGETRPDDGVSFEKPSLNTDPASFLLPQKPAAVPAKPAPQAEPQPAPEPAPVPVAEPTPQPEQKGGPQAQTSVQSLRTFRADIEQTIQTQNASLASIAAAESERRSQQIGRTALDVEEAVRSPLPLKKLLMLGGGLIAILGGIAALSLLFVREKPQGIVEIQGPVAFIAVDDVAELPLPATRAALISTLSGLRADTRLPLGLIRAVYPTQLSSTTKELVPARDFLALLSPDMPAVLARTLQSDFMLGIHSFEDNQLFFIIKIASFEQAFAGMLEWEPMLARDLAPLFRTPAPQLQGESASTTSFSFYESPFVDRTIQSRDTRVVTSAGQIVFLYTFLDRETILLTTNEHTLQEVLTRLKDAPIL